MENRLAVRNVHLYEASTGRPLGGFYQAGSITESNLHDMLYNVLLIIEDQQLLTITYQASGQIITPSNNMVEPGDYVIASNGTIIVTDEPWVERISSHSNSSRTQSFRDGVQNRDGRCVVSGVLNANAPGWWIGFQAAHVFPLEHVSYWVRGNFAQWITDMDGIVSEAKINSVQNGLLMSSTLHSCFDNYMFSINPDDGYKIVSFAQDLWGVDGRVLDPVCRDPHDPHRVSDELLRWHFRQSVFANVQGAGEPVFEEDFPPGTDKMETLRNEPYGKERLELELALRLKPVVDP